ncbi:uncharacterized protein KY384_000318 [Bacidia gigantensis]|uniref:uncharacterized protein n=1 Tax=Bacidia gigantensis TaxID=2732470 RepID=UPI001D057039|nr:uncharacterized protein KY384_000318 [Bacidia gigantensis]KAG8526325.1 hypothetical protein KY384_000318 [Bacidia gigantensis]
MRKTTGYLLHPSIPLDSGSSELKIADIGTGTGVWLLELAEELPSSYQLHGFDVSSAGFSDQSWLPDNVSFRALNAFEPPPKELWGQYDIVHIRLFVMVIEEDPIPVIDHCMKLLKPGGHLQWDELNLSDLEIVKSKPDVSTESLQRMVDNAKTHSSQKWVPQLPTTLTQSGFDKPTVSYHKPPPCYRKMWMEADTVATESLAANVADANGPLGPSEALKALAKGCHKETQQGAAIVKMYQVVTARKPL